jgi:transposase-like protein
MTKSLERVINDFNQELPNCPVCKSNTKIIKSGKRKNKQDTIQLYFCKNCNRRFTDKKITRTTYPPKIILHALSNYNHGHTLYQTSKIMRKKYKTSIPISTIKNWVHRYKDEFPFIKLRKEYSIDPDIIIQTKKLQHQQLFLFKVNTLKLNLAGKQFPKLKYYINSMIKNPQDHIFQNKNVLRCSELAKKIKIETPRIKQISTNIATNLTNLGLAITKTNKERHQVIENFFLINDSVTMATEIPVYILKKESDFENDLVGHIDLIQVRNNKIHILDYKPEIENQNNSITQLSLYAKALSIRTSLPESYFVCAYFNENGYYQFNFS